MKRKEFSSNKYSKRSYIVRSDGTINDYSLKRIKEESNFDVHTLGLEDTYNKLFIDSMDISQRYRFEKCYHKLQQGRKSNQGLEGRFDSMEERLNCIEDMTLVAHGAINEIEEIINDVEKDVREDIDTKTSLLIESLNRDIEKSKRESIKTSILAGLGISIVSSVLRTILSSIRRNE